MSESTLAALRVTLALAEERCARAYWRWREAHRAVRLARKALRAAEAQATPKEPPCLN